MRIFVPALPRLAGIAALVLVSACAVDSPVDPLSASYSKGGGKPKATHDPILFVYGYNGRTTTWSTMISRFKRDGWSSSQLVNFSYDHHKSNKTTASLISATVDSILSVTGASKVDIITHSMGTLSARFYIDSLHGEGKVDALVSLGGPNHGTTTASICVFDVSCVEMLPNSTFLTELNTDETPGFERYATWRSPCDEVINPHDSVILNGAQNTLTACMSHSQLHEDATVYKQVRDWVNAPWTTIALTP